MLQLATCQDVLPISSPGKKFKCPAGTQYNPQAGVKTGPTTSICCVVSSQQQQQEWQQEEQQQQQMAATAAGVFQMVRLIALSLVYVFNPSCSALIPADFQPHFDNCDLPLCCAMLCCAAARHL